MNRSGRVVTLVSPLLIACAALAHAQVVRVEVTSREPMAPGKSSPRVGPYELVRGRIYGEVDPGDRRNTIIQDLALAPRNEHGRVEYVATFAVAKPVDLSKASGVLIYTVVNRGNGEPVASPDGHISLVSGWQGDLAPTSRTQTIAVPIAHNADGTSITGPVVARFANVSDGTNTVTLRLGSMGSGPPAYPPNGLDQPKATLTSIGFENAHGERRDVRPIPRTDWVFADCRSTPFPGTPDPTRLCVKDGFDTARLYELTYIAKDPLVLGIGLAATRDIVSFFRHAPPSASLAMNPIAGAVRHVVAIGDSQSGNFIRTFLHLGFNEDLRGGRVWDGAFPRIAARQTPMNVRFAVPGGAAALYEPGSEPVLWWSPYDDVRRRRRRASLLDRCRATRTCPKIVEAFGSAELWGLRMSPDLVGTDAARDIPLPDNVRRYYYPGTTHGGGRGGFTLVPDTGGQGACVLPANPNPQAETTRALTAALVDWVVRGTPPPPSRYPLLSRGELAAPSEVASVYAAMPNVPDPSTLVNPVLDYDFGTTLIANDLTGVLTTVPPRIVQVLPTLVPRVDADGNESSGVASVLHQAPLGTYLGWNVTAAGFFKGQGCGFVGGYVPFARTKAERLKANDPRPSLEERYGTKDGYVCVVRKIVDAAVAARFLLPDDGERLYLQATGSSSFPTAASIGSDAYARGQALCKGDR